MRYTNSIAVGSPTARVVAIMVATLLIAISVVGAGIAGSRLLAADGDIIVDPSGNGTTTTISAAVAIAQDGDTITVMPGTYRESVVITRDIEIVGQGDGSDVFLEYDLDGPTVPGSQGSGPIPYGFLLEGTDATIKNLTVDALGVAFVIEGGAPTIIGVAADDPVETDSAGEPKGEVPPVWESGAFLVRGGSTARIEDSSTDGWIDINDAAPTLIGNDIANYVSVTGESNLTIQGNRIAHITVWQSKVSGVIEDNEVTGSPWPDEEGSAVLLNLTDGSDLVFQRNDVGGPTYPVAVEIIGEGTLTLKDNVILGSATGITHTFGASTVLRLESNQVRDSQNGVTINAHRGEVTLEGNVIESNVIGLVLSGGSDSSFVGNRICDNETNVALNVGASMPDADSNEICADAPAE